MPGRVKTGVSSSPIGAEALRLAGLHADAAEPHRAVLGQRLLDDVEVALAHAAAGDDDVGADQLVAQRLGEGVRLVGDDADAVGDRAGGAGGGGEEVGVAVVDRVVAQRRAGVAELGPGGDHHDARSRAGAYGRAAHRGEHAEVARAEDGALLEQHVALGDVVAGRPDVLARLGGTVDAHLGDAAVGPLVGDDRGGAGRHRGAGHDLDRGARRHREDRRLAGPDLTDDGQHDGRVLGGAGDVVGDHGVAVHRGVVEARQRDRRHDVLGQRRGRAPPSAAAGRPGAARSWRGCARRSPPPAGGRGAAQACCSCSSRTVPPSTRCADVDASATSPTTFTSRPKVQSPSTLNESASRSDGAPSGKRLSKSPTSL